MKNIEIKITQNSTFNYEYRFDLNVEVNEALINCIKIIEGVDVVNRTSRYSLSVYIGKAFESKATIQSIVEQLKSGDFEQKEELPCLSLKNFLVEYEMANIWWLMIANWLLGKNWTAKYLAKRVTRKYEEHGKFWNWLRDNPNGKLISFVEGKDGMAELKYTENSSK